MLLRGEPTEISELKEKTKEFLSNNGVKPSLSESPDVAVIPYTADRGTSFKTYVEVLDILLAAHHELRAEYLKISVDEYLRLDPKDPEENALIKLAKAKYKITISEQEPNDFN